MLLKDRIRTLRTERGWNQTELARRAGLSQGAITNLETGARDNPTQTTLEKLAVGFEISVAALIEGTSSTAALPVAQLREWGIDEERIARYIRLWPHLSHEVRTRFLDNLYIKVQAERTLAMLEAQAEAKIHTLKGQLADVQDLGREAQTTQRQVAL